MTTPEHDETQELPPGAAVIVATGELEVIKGGCDEPADRKQEEQR